MTKTATLAALAAAATLAVAPGSASAACVPFEETFLYTKGVGCVTAGTAGGATVAASAGGGATILGSQWVLAPINVGKTGYDRGVWVNGSPLASD